MSQTPEQMGPAQNPPRPGGHLGRGTVRRALGHAVSSEAKPCTLLGAVGHDCCCPTPRGGHDQPPWTRELGKAEDIRVVSTLCSVHLPAPHVTGSLAADRLLQQPHLMRRSPSPTRRQREHSGHSLYTNTPKCALPSTSDDTCPELILFFKTSAEAAGEATVQSTTGETSPRVPRRPALQRRLPTSSDF